MKWQREDVMALLDMLSSSCLRDSNDRLKINCKCVLIARSVQMKGTLFRNGEAFPHFWRICCENNSIKSSILFTMFWTLSKKIEIRKYVTITISYNNHTSHKNTGWTSRAPLTAISVVILQNVLKYIFEERFLLDEKHGRHRTNHIFLETDLKTNLKQYL